jgi:hypothetical protein
VRGFAIVVSVAILAWIVIAGPAALLGGDGPEVTVPALLVCLAPNLLALGVAEFFKNRSELTRTAVLLITFVGRLFLVIGLGFAVYFLLPYLKGRELSWVLWGAVFYLILLAAESRVVARRVAGATAGR